jgi:phage terminase Nu1 subunit (DNA packaging protein)
MRWSIAAASTEFPVDRKTLTKYLRQGDIIAGADKKYSTTQICQAVFGDIDSEKLRLTREQADKHYLDNQRTKELLVERAAVAKFCEKSFVAIRQKILGSSLSGEEQDEILLDLKAIKSSPWARAIDEPLTI